MWFAAPLAEMAAPTAHLTGYRWTADSVPDSLSARAQPTTVTLQYRDDNVLIDVCTVRIHEASADVVERTQECLVDRIINAEPEWSRAERRRHTLAVQQMPGEPAALTVDGQRRRGVRIEHDYLVACGARVDEVYVAVVAPQAWMDQIRLTMNSAVG